MLLLRLIVTTVERTVLDRPDVVKITVPTDYGVITILPKHEPLMTVCGMGELLVSFEDGKQKSYFVDGGVVQVADNEVEILTSIAEEADELDEAKIEEARRRAEKLKQEKPIDIDIARVEIALQRELARLKLARKRKRA